ncbi:MAG TPA: non-homologous end-joining DNA ligase [Usitatibacter sp.]|nr:non-homologous end-joining DNA ligase [Usitatibacter sp.]
MSVPAGAGAGTSVAGIRITHPERVLFEEMALTKADLARYYESVAEWIVPEVRDRPLSLVRCPQGPGEGCFYQKNIDDRFPAEIGRVEVELGGGGVYASADSLAAIVGLVQMGVIELHVWGATTRDLARPDRMVFDLDPDTAVPWREVMAAAHRTRQRLEDLGLESFAKTSGGKGLHVVVPLSRRHEWDEVKAFSKALAEELAREEPGLFVTTASKRQRSGRIFIDYLRNAEGATTVAAYSVRARKGAPVSTPLHWDEVGGRLKPGTFHAANVARRMRGLRSDPWKAFRRTSQVLTLAMKRKLGVAE